jgi:putative aminopeptidase FrvX
MTLPETLQAIMAHIDSDVIYTDVDQHFERLSQLVEAHAPANGCQLDGSIGDTIRSMANEFSLTLSTDERIISSGNIALEIGADKADIDLVITAHMDRPSFRVLSESEGTLYPICAIRIEGDEYIANAKAARYQDGEMTVTARGKIIIKNNNGDYHMTFQTEEGQLNWGDTVLMDAVPQRQGDMMTATGLDNVSGVLLALLSARVLQSFSEVLEKQAQKILIVFTDQEEGPPIGLFGQGAARLSSAIPPPRLGFINIDAQNVDATVGNVPNVGIAHSFVSGRGRGSVVPLDYQALAESTAKVINEQRPNTVKPNYGYVSRSDDMLLSLWSRCLGLIGVPLAHAHTTEETISLNDVVSGVYWIPAFITSIFSSHQG